MNWKYHFAVVATLSFNSCVSQDRSSKHNFIINYGNRDFREFKNYSLFVRSFEDRGKSVCIIVLNKKDTGNCRLPYTLVIKKNTLSVVEIRNSITRIQPCSLDSAVARKLAIELLKMNVYGIGVDSNGNVFVNTRFNEEQTAELIRFSDRKFLTGVYLKNYKPVSGSWYERSE